MGIVRGRVSEVSPVHLPGYVHVDDIGETLIVNNLLVYLSKREMGR